MVSPYNLRKLFVNMNTNKFFIDSLKVRYFNKTKLFTIFDKTNKLIYR
jgi:hypothetical protein